MTTIPPGFAQVIHTFSVVNDPEPMAVTTAVGLDNVAPAGLQAVCSAIHEVARTFHAGIAIESCSIVSTVLRYVPPGGTDPLVAEKVLALAGGNTGDALTQNTTWLFKKQTSFGGRRNRGRMFWPGVRANVVDDAGNLTSTVVAGYTVNLETYRAGVNGVTGVTDMVLLHTPAPDGSLPIPTLITAIVCDRKVATQRRRLRR